MLGFSPYGFGAVTVKRAAGLLIDGVDIRVFGVSCQYRFVIGSGAVAVLQRGQEFRG